MSDSVMKFILIAAIPLMLIACSKKLAPVITERKSAAPIGKISVYPPSPTLVADAIAGKEIFITRCGRCHGLPAPIEFTFKRWDGILTSMVPKARLTAQQSADITAYINENAKK